jgi:amino acid adenylation domain-containing protein
LGKALSRRAAVDTDALEALVAACWTAVLSRCVGEPEISHAVIRPDGGMECVTSNVADVTWAELAAGLQRRPLAGRANSAVDVYGSTGPDRSVPVFAADLIVRVDVDAGTLAIAYDTEHVSHAAAERVIGYLLHALSAAVAAPGEVVDLAEMLGPHERRRQLEALSGPVVNNGPDGFIQAFQARAASRPESPAARHREATLSYGELDRASDKVARRLRARGIGPGHAVAVVSDRHLGWIVAMLGVLRAGGIYLPVRPDFPAARVEDQLRQAECTLALTDAAGSVLMSAVSGSGAWQGTLLAIDDLHVTETDGPKIDLGDPGLGDPAYVYFTSGSTGRPKGAVCKHAGMINHLWAKVDDHDLGPADVLAQTASQCFDISLWQVCAALVVGGQTVVVDLDAQLDVKAFADLLARYAVTTLQLVPSYLEVLLAHLESGAVELPRLKSVSVTGEALKPDLVRRWFAVVPSVRLINAYGATEVSDDAMHEVLDGPPPRDLAAVNVGRPLRNMRVYVMDDLQRLMPEGARGEIVFAGVCVGSGYLNDPERTSEAFGSDPYHPNERLYRSGDLGRWLPEGRIEFLGRRDEQVKIRGLRVELGEIHAALLRVPGIAAAAVVQTGDGQGARLVAFYVSEQVLASVDLHDLLSVRLPEYMVPAHYVRLARLPLNENGKTDKRLLKTVAAELAVRLHAFEPPRSDAEQRLATLWAEVIGIPAGTVGRKDSFFDLGGTSLSAIHLLMRLDHQLSLADVMTRQVLADQASLLDAAAGGRQNSLLHGLGTPAGDVPVLVCVPNAGGNAIDFQHLADEAGGQFGVLAVELPGHDLARPDEPLLPLARLSTTVAAELVAGPTAGELYLWGQGAGAVVALELSRVLADQGVPVAGVGVAWDDTTPTNIDEAKHLTDDEVADLLRRRRAYVEVAGSSRRRLRLVARAYRHDWMEAMPVLDRLGAGPGMTAPVLEFTLGAVPARLAAVPGVRRERLAPTDPDVARYHPDRILGVIDGWREGRVSARH